MEMTGEQLIPASQQETWEALNDPEVKRYVVGGELHRMDEEKTRPRA